MDAENLLQSVEQSFPPLEEIKQSYQAISNYFQVAIGAGSGMSFDFNLEVICNNYKLKPVTVFNSIRFLEKEKYLSYPG